jgi:hypothetical protein
LHNTREWYEETDTDGELSRHGGDDDAVDHYDLDASNADCNASNFKEEAFEIFDLMKYGFQYNNMEDWTIVR